MHCKTYIFFYIPIYGCKALLSLQLFLEILFPEAVLIVDEQISQNSMILLMAIFGVMIAVYAVDNIIGVVDMIVSTFR